MEQEIRADEVKPGGYLLGLGLVQSYTESGPRRNRRVTLHSEGGDWRVSVDPRHRVVVVRSSA